MVVKDKTVDLELYFLSLISFFVYFHFERELVAIMIEVVLSGKRLGKTRGGPAHLRLTVDV